MPTLLKAAPVAESVYQRVTQASKAVQSRSGHLPTLVTVLVGADPASQIYVRKKGEMCRQLGLGHRDITFATDTSQEKLLTTIRELNADDSVDGILVQKPLPKQISEAAVFSAIDPAKDVDCFSPHNAGLLVQGSAKLLPCTPAGVMEILKHHKIDIAGKNALVVGRSDIVGKPMALLLLHANATVTIAHSKTKDLAARVAESDIVVAAIGKDRFLRGSLPWKREAVVIDVGMNRSPEGKLTGDVEFDAVSPKVAAITPVPGGVGPMTIAMLMVNTVRAARLRRGLPEDQSGI